MEYPTIRAIVPRLNGGYPGAISMTIARKTITLTSQQDQWVKAQIAAGRFTNDSEYIRDLIRCDRERNTSFQELTPQARQPEF